MAAGEAINFPCLHTLHNSAEPKALTGSLPTLATESMVSIVSVSVSWSR